MNYKTVKALALSYTDRKDQEVINRMDDFLRVIEARINRRIRVGNQTKRATLNTSSADQYIGLPADFGGMRDIQIQRVDPDTSVVSNAITPSYVSPEVMNQNIFLGFDGPVYTIIAGQLQLFPVTDDSQVEIVYYATLPQLSAAIPDTWLSDLSPDVYVFGLCVEISGFVKDAQAGQIWDARFEQELARIENIDTVDRWSGAALQIKLG